MPQRPLDPDDPTSTIFTVRLPTKVVERIRNEAKRAGETQSVYVRRLLDAAGPTTTAEAAATNEKPAPDDPALYDALKRNYDALTDELAATKARIQQIDPDSALARERAKNMPKTAQQKLDAAMRRMEREFAFRVQDASKKEARKWLDEMSLPHWKERIEEAERLFKRRKGVFTKAEYTAIVKCLHLDAVFKLEPDEATMKKFNEAFDLFNGKKLLLLPEKELPTDPNLPPLPSTVAEWQARRTKK